GSGSYSFLLAVSDNDAVDNNGLVEVRMKIWDASKGESTGVLYDTQPSAADSAVPTTPLGVNPPPSPAPPGGAGNSGGNKDPHSPLIVDFLIEQTKGDISHRLNPLFEI